MAKHHNYLCRLVKKSAKEDKEKYVRISASRLKTAGELKIALAGTSRRSMRERCMSVIDSNTDKPGLGPTHQQSSDY